MSTLCFAGPGCMGCSMCESDPDTESALEKAQFRKRKEDALRAQGKPTLQVKFGDFLKQVKL